MDNQILRDLFTAYLEACEQLGSDDPLQDEARSARSRLPPDRIGRAGQLQEWLEDWDMDAPEIHHRHVSHLYGLHPSHQIGIDTPQLAAAARRSLEIRGDEAAGWGIGWRFNQWARLTTLARIDHAHAADERGFPDWAQALNRRLDELAATYRASILANAPSLGA